MVTSEGTRLQTSSMRWRLHVSAETKAEDGMELSQNYIFSSATEAGLPSDEEVAAAFQGVIDQVLALREAPIVEPYTGPAILRNRASGVFFHEIFGHRIEGHRQKDVEEGQTFTKKIGKLVLPEFMSVHDNPLQRRFRGIDLRGWYLYDDEGIPPQDVVLVDKGILKTFLLSRRPGGGLCPVQRPRTPPARQGRGRSTGQTSSSVLRSSFRSTSCARCCWLSARSRTSRTACCSRT